MKTTRKGKLVITTRLKSFQYTRKAAVVLTEGQWSWLTRRARQLGWSRAALIRHLIAMGIARIGGRGDEFERMAREAEPSARGAEVATGSRRVTHRFIEKFD